MHGFNGKMRSHSVDGFDADALLVQFDLVTKQLLSRLDIVVLRPVDGQGEMPPKGVESDLCDVSSAGIALPRNICKVPLKFTTNCWKLHVCW